MGQIIARSLIWGAKFGTIVASATALVLWWYWGSQAGGQPGIALMALIFWVPSMAILGGAFAIALFGVVGVVMSLHPLRLEPSPISYAVLASLLSCGLYLPWAAGGLNGLHALWVRGGLHAVLHGDFGKNDSGFVLLLPIVIAGLLVGWKVRNQE
jgi:hypothetical protein